MAKQFKTVDDFERYAKENLPRDVMDYIKFAAGNGQTYHGNINSFRRWRFRPRFLRDISNLSLTTTVLGQTISCPIGIAPSAGHGLVTSNKELATANAARKVGTCYIYSFWANTSVEDMRRACSDTFTWAQINPYAFYEILPDYVSRLEKAGFKAVVLTVDTPRYEGFVVSAANLPCRWVNYEHYESMGKVGEVSRQLHETKSNTSIVNWSFVKYVKSITKLPVIFKGILSRDDAELAAEAGVDAIIVSNHGGRTMDSFPATIDVLEDIVKGVAGRSEVYLDGGVRSGLDVFKALALGARCVFIGRPILWGLSHSGEEGAIRVLDILQSELKNTMAMCGCKTVKDIVRPMVIHESEYPRL